jgi:hypothetical protein
MDSNSANIRICCLFAIVIFSGSYSCRAHAQQGDATTQAMQARLDQLAAQLAAQQDRIKELEGRLDHVAASNTGTPQPGISTAPSENPLPSPPPSGETAPVLISPAPAPEPAEHEHTMSMPGGGPQLKIQGFADFNLGFGSDANSLIFPLVPIGTTAHNTFEIGEFDLFLSSRLSKKISFLSEVVIGADQTNYWGLDIERLQTTFKASRYFAISGGRYHTAIGYYNTTFHHGTWFQTATGRPFMYFFEDSGGPLPVHQVGITATGLVPHSGSLDLHWVAEVGNGRSSDPNGQPVQNFLSDKNHKAFNLAAYIKPHQLPGLQVGGSFYRDRMVPAGVPHVDQNIGSAYAVFTNSSWEFFNEVVLVNDHSDGATKSDNSPMMYTQLSHKYGKYRPYVRYQYLNVNASDPTLIFTGRYQGPSGGLRMDFTDYVALKVQYNRLDQRNVPAANGLDLQMAFAF